MKTRPVPKDADVMSMKEFRSACDVNALTDDDGAGYFCLNSATMTDVAAVPSQVVRMSEKDMAKYDAVAWFNK